MAPMELMVLVQWHIQVFLLPWEQQQQHSHEPTINRVSYRMRKKSVVFMKKQGCTLGARVVRRVKREAICVNDQRGIYQGLPASKFIDRGDVVRTLALLPIPHSCISVPCFFYFTHKLLDTTAKQNAFHASIHGSHAR